MSDTRAGATGSIAPERSPRLRLGLVLPRFGPDLWGGAELHGRWLAERLAGDGHAVDVLTTCVRDHRTWRNEFRPGVERTNVDRLTVRRFEVDQRDARTHAQLQHRIEGGERLSRDDELAWLRNGGTSTSMERYIAAHAHEFDLVLAMPYLWGTTYFAFTNAQSRFVLIPCLHDEPYAHLSFVREMLESSRGILFNTEPEAAVAKALTDRLADWGIAAVGFDPAVPSNVVGTRRKYGLDDPYVLYIGRREGGKNTPLLIDYFARYKSRRGGNLRMVFLGDGDPVPSTADFVEMKMDPNSADRDALIAGSVALCQPSVNESLSIVLMEGWSAGAAVIVNGRCAVTRYHCERSNGGLWFENYAEFEAVADRLTGDPQLRSDLAANGRAYVEREYSWPVVLDRFNRAVGQWVSAGS